MSDSTKLHPSLLWSQDEKNVFITVKLSDVENPTLQIGKNSISFQATGVGANGLRGYAFSLDLFNSVDEEDLLLRTHSLLSSFVGKFRHCQFWNRLA